ncbi:unnamed protein product, partial [Mesorhabditis spiculigera]
MDADTQQLLDMIIELSGVGEAVDVIARQKFETIEKQDEMKGPNGQSLTWKKENVTEELGKEEAHKVDVMEQLQRMYTPRQLEEMRHSGYTAMTPRQLDYVYGTKSPYSNSEALDNLKRTNLTRENVDLAIHDIIRNVAQGDVKFRADPHNKHAELDKFDKSRKKDIVLSPIAFLPVINNPALVSQPLILSPVIFSYLLGSPAIFGAIVLSPWLFVILNPFGFVPIILTPLALTPVILSPGIFNPFVLSPLVLCPFIVSPQAFTPLILSPFALTPNAPFH